MVKGKSPIDYFFTLGDKVTKGNPVRKAQFDYYLMWIMFGAFVMIAGSNFNAFWQTGSFKYLGWSIVILAICWFQYFSLKMAREAVKLMSRQPMNTKYNQVEDVNAMMELTKDEKGGKKNNGKQS